MNPNHAIQAAVVSFFVMAVGLNLWVQRQRGVQAFVLSQRPAKRLAEIVAITGLFSWFGLIGLEGFEVVRERLGPVWIDFQLADTIGAVLMLCGLIVGLLAYLHMGRSWRIGIDEAANEKLVTHGVFAFSRNPIYLFIDMLALGVLLASGSAFFVVTSPVVLVGVHLLILEEERFLSRRYGSEFETYCALTGRYVGTQRWGSGVER